MTISSIEFEEFLTAQDAHMEACAYDVDLTQPAALFALEEVEA